jgi:hypothetical protein
MKDGAGHIMIISVSHKPDRFPRSDLSGLLLIGENYHEIDPLIILNILLRKVILERAYSQKELLDFI